MKKRRCTRYEHDGSPCVQWTTYVDRWCRECDGYATPEPAGGVPVKAVYRFETPRKITEVPDQGEFIRVTNAAILHFLRHHPGFRRGAAGVEIHRLVGDMLRKRDGGARASQSRLTGAWALSTWRPHGYGVLLSPDGGHVLGYQTTHVERTYAQMKQGVRSRVSHKEEKSVAYHVGHLLAMRVALGEIDEEAARLRALGHGHPRAAKTFERLLEPMRAHSREYLEVRRRQFDPPPQ